MSETLDILDIEILEKEPKEHNEVIVIEMDQAKIQLAQMAALGNSVTVIANTLGRSEAWVRQYKKSNDVKALVMELQREAIESAKLTLTNGAAKAAETICLLMEDSNPGIKLAASRDVLDRLGMKAVERKEITTNVNINADPEERKKLLMERFKRLEMVD